MKGMLLLLYIGYTNNRALKTPQSSKAQASGRKLRPCSWPLLGHAWPAAKLLGLKVQYNLNVVCSDRSD